MDEFENIRPYHDGEVREVVERIVNHPDLAKAAAKLLLPGILRGTTVGEWVTNLLLRVKTRDLDTVDACQTVIADYFANLVEETTVALTHSGIENLTPGQPYLFTSNHRDIVMDSSLINYLIHNHGHETCRMAVGDNLLTHDLAADLMKLNKSFVVDRSARGTRAGYRVLARTSAYIKHSIDEGVSVWIAQREGRAKDGYDRTDPALLKMLSLAHRDKAALNKSDGDPLRSMIEAYQLVPVSVSYELDPCALAKAHELFVTATEGCYAKSAEEDVESIITGLVGMKGRVHVHFSAPVEPRAFESPDELAEHIDRSIVGGLKVFPTHVAAAKEMGMEEIEPAQVPEQADVMALFEAERDRCPESERPFWLEQYGNLIKNRLACGVVGVNPSDR